jgi:hypothetical protein
MQRKEENLKMRSSAPITERRYLLSFIVRRYKRITVDAAHGLFNVVQSEAE